MRHKKQTLGAVQPSVVEYGQLNDLLTHNHPLSSTFNPAVGDTSRELLWYCLGLQKALYKTTILEQFSYRILQRNFSLLLKKYSPLEIKRGIALAILYSDRPFSTSFVEKAIKQWRVAPSSKAM